MGINILVYRNPMGDCTLDGVSSKSTMLCVVNAEGPFSPSEAVPAVMLHQHIRGALRLVPAYFDGKAWTPVDMAMFGGNYGSTSDGRFIRKCEELLMHDFYGAVAIHDRIEK